MDLEVCDAGTQMFEILLKNHTRTYIVLQFVRIDTILKFIHPYLINNLLNQSFMLRLPWRTFNFLLVVE